MARQPQSRRCRCQNLAPSRETASTAIAAAALWSCLCSWALTFSWGAAFCSTWASLALDTELATAPAPIGGLARSLVQSAGVGAGRARCPTHAQRPGRHCPRTRPLCCWLCGPHSWPAAGPGLLELPQGPRLQLALPGARALAEDAEDEHGAVAHAHVLPQRLVQGAQLPRAQLIVLRIRGSTRVPAASLHCTDGADRAGGVSCLALAWGSSEYLSRAC